MKYQKQNVSSKSLLKSQQNEKKKTGINLTKEVKGLYAENYKILIKTLMLGKIEGKRIKGQQRVRWLDSITNSMDMSKLRETETTGKPGVLQSMGSQSGMT